MSALLTPKTVDSGWFRRWCRQGWALWTRAPMLFVLNLLLPPIIMAWMPPIGSVKILLIVPLSAGIFIELRLLDQHSDARLSRVWEMLRGNLKDVALLTRDLFLWLFALTVILAIARWHSETMTTTKAASITSQALAHGGILETHAFLGVSGWLSLLCEPMAAPILFLTLLVGHQLSMHMHTAYRGIFKNGRIAVLFLVVCFLGNGALSTLTVWLQPMMGNDGALMLTTLIAAWLLIFFATLGYLWCREMFEGQKENAPQRKAVSMATKICPTEA
ncbi:hypothetical protein RIE95_09035 [Acidithiobacillus thiooxidans]|uniref:hypothetical protein n=1 Tax=Acidithiobacillus thiooxidans TaxID=930 RepID=UPI00286443FF|nr:hypothetical protein [Acidithiobacillus thiooxidans]MDR7927120.1 hypothetical protein [Acidithiobacillus thiooxidans]